jgi:hypothetical protein
MYNNPYGQNPNNDPTMNYPTYQNSTPYSNQYQPNAYQPPTKPPSWFGRQKRITKIGIGCGSLVVILLLCSICSLAFASGNTTHPSQTASISQATPTNALVQSTSQLTPIPTPSPTLAPTPTPVPPTTVSVRQVQPTPTPVPTQPPASSCSGTVVNGICYNFDSNGGSYVYSPASSFCAYFSCISNFPNGTGYVVECNDGKFSKSGGKSGSCSQHGGNMRPIFQH